MREVIWKRRALLWRNQSGRSMIEMLAVLAIIGVLSVGALTGFTYAMNKYRANQTINDVLSYAGVVLTADVFQSALIDEILEPIELKDMTTSSLGYPIHAVKETDDVFCVGIQNVPQKVCHLIVDGPNPSDFAVGVNNTSFADLTTPAVCQESNDMNFYYDAIGKSKCGTAFCLGNQVCLNDVCSCPINTHLDGNTCVCNAGYEMCDKGCYSFCTGDNIARNPKTCQCECDTSKGYEALPVEGICVCPSDTILIDGRCRVMNCSGGTPGNQNWTCFIDGQRCGTTCSQNGLNCIVGMCVDECIAGTSWQYHAVTNVYGCHNQTQTTCVRQAIGRDGIFCFHDGASSPCARTCALDATNCYFGFCDNRCPPGTSYTSNLKVDYFQGYGCLNDKNVWCTLTQEVSVWCFDENGKTCGRGSDCSLAGCDAQFCPTDQCPTGQYWDEPNKACRNYCPAGSTYQYNELHGHGCLNGNVWCAFNPGSNNFCLYNGNWCGAGCLDLKGKSCSFGLCEPSECTSIGLTYQAVSSYYGCYDATSGISCTKYSGVYYCYKNNLQCGFNCGDLLATNCQTCRTSVVCPEGEPIYQGGTPFCYNSASNASCPLSGICTINGSLCGIGCDLSGRHCTNGGICNVTDCPAGHELRTTGRDTFGCFPSDATLSCAGGSCTIGGNRCGSGCSSTGANCAMGVCESSECISSDGTILGFDKVTNLYYGCVNANGIKCYRENGTYTCYKNNTECGAGCHEDGTGGSCDTGCA